MHRFTEKLSERIVMALIYTIMVLFMILCVYPFYYIFIYSISDPFKAASGVLLWPAGFSTNTYRTILSMNEIYVAFFISLSRAVLGASVVVLCSSFFAYLVTQKKMYMRKIIYRICVISMYLNAGLIPWYLTMKAYGLKDNYLLYILPWAVGPFFVILMKSYLESLPASLEEAAKIDGAGHIRVFWSILFPASLPIVATIAVFSSVGHWNAWVDNFFLVNNANLQTLQMKLYEFLMQAESIARASKQTSTLGKSMPALTPLSVKMCITIITTLPILCVYPFMQRYFIKGILIGAIKG